MQRIVSNIRHSPFIRHNVIFFVGSLIMGLLNYLYYPAMGRLLHPGSFGEVQALFSLFAQISIFLNVLGMITVTIVSNYDDEAARNRIILELEKLAVCVSVVFLLAIVLSSTVLQRFFHFDSMWPFMLLGLAALTSVPLAFRTGFLRGRQKFGLAALAGIVSGAFDLVLSVAFVLLGWGTVGAIAGLVLAQIIAFGFAAHKARQQGFEKSLRRQMFRLPDIRLILPELKYAGLVLIGSLAITGLYSIDTVVVKHYFSAHTAGLYAGISTVARIIFFLTASVTQVLLPSVKRSHSPRQNQAVLLKSFALLTVLGGSALLVFALLPRLIIKLLMGSVYISYADLLPRLSLVIFLISVLNLFILYHMALRRYAIALIVIIGVTVAFGLLHVHHQSLRAIIDSLLYASVAMLSMLGLWVGGITLKKSSS